MSRAIAHIRQADGATQPLADHLLATADLAADFCGKIGQAECGRLLGLLHDFGKYSSAFQRYLNSAAGRLEPDMDGWVDAARLKGKIDHSTAGARHAWRRGQGTLPAQMLALALCSHHSGLVDCLSPDGKRVFWERMGKKEGKACLDECLEKADPDIAAAVEAAFDSGALADLAFLCRSVALAEATRGASASKGDTFEARNSAWFQCGLLARFLLSCLLDADRINSAEFEDPAYAALRAGLRTDWAELSGKLEKKFASFPGGGIDDLRDEIAGACLRRAPEAQGLFTLTVPTGGGKTLASLRFALNHAREHGLERVIYIIPYTSIIDQNAEVARKILEQDAEAASAVLEQHSSLDPEKESWRAKLLAANWEAPVVFTTMVQFLESLFGPGTRSARRMHCLARSVLVFDEIQTLPLKCAHMFCQALNFLARHCGTSAVLCTATQPLLGAMPNPLKGSLELDRGRELAPDPPRLFRQLRRTVFLRHAKPMSDEEVTALAREELAALARDKNEREPNVSCLIVANTRRRARALYELCAAQGREEVFFLSTDLCQAHRRAVLADMTRKLDKKQPLICCSTQLVECGVDVDFGAVIRYQAGLDSILQAAGRCNRHGKQARGRVHVVAPLDDDLLRLPDIAKGRAAFEHLVSDGESLLLATEADWNDPDLIRKYFFYSFHGRAEEMAYPARERGQDMLYRLGRNAHTSHFDPCAPLLQQSFASAAKAFNVIDSPTTSVIVPYGRGGALITELCSRSGLFEKKRLLREAQQYTVNIYKHVFDRLGVQRALHSVPEAEVWTLDAAWYDDILGLCEEPAANHDPGFLSA